jgi:beta-glucosidase
MPWLDKVAGVVEAWYPGSNGGEAIARVLAGDVDAAGRLPVTFPTAATQLPRPEIPGLIEKKNSKGEISYGLDYGLKAFDVDYNIEGANVGYRWFEHQKLKPLFPFGYGLSYTRFTYSGLSLDPSNSLQVNFTVKNAGKRPGIATPQIYASVPGRDGVPVKRLVGWQRVTLKPGETRSLTVRIDPRLLANFDVANQRWKVAAGAYHLVLGKSSADSSTTTTVQLSELSIAP